MSVRSLLDLTGRVALVTGGSRGLGLQIAEGLGEMGAAVAITARKQDELDEAAAHLTGLGIRAKTIRCDLSQPDAIEPLVDAVLAEFGAMHILVNNAGAAWGAPTAEHPLDAWSKVLGLNLTAAFLLCQAVGRRVMIPAGYGKIVNVASIAGLKGNPHTAMPTIAYNTSKGGMVNFTRALATEWARHGITVNAIAPGFFPSRMTRGTLDRYGADIVARNPMGRIGGDEDLKGVAVLLASRASDYITGQVIAVDGGVSSQ
jgi:NAD(P)-dependent dehydrogenase (short-subunit alcohol dehydrogenase family)